MYKHFMRCNICWYCIRFEEFTSFFLFLKYFDCSLHIRLINIFDFYEWISHKKTPPGNLPTFTFEYNITS